MDDFLGGGLGFTLHPIIPSTDMTKELIFFPLDSYGRRYFLFFYFSFVSITLSSEQKIQVFASVSITLTSVLVSI